MQYHTANVLPSAHCFSSPAQIFEQPSLSLQARQSAVLAAVAAAADEAAKQWYSGWLSPGAPAPSAPSFEGLLVAAQTLTPVGNTGVKGGQTLSETLERLSQRVCIDTLTLSFPGLRFDGCVVRVSNWLRRVSFGGLEIGGELERRYNGYAKCYAVTTSDGSVAPNLGWVGVSAASDHMRGRWCLHLTGAACRSLTGISKQREDGIAVVTPWQLIAEDAGPYGMRITRVDLAADDLEGEHSVQVARDMYAAGAFSCNGRPPSYKFIETSDGQGCTFYVGKVCSGKMLRVYEKGKQLGDKQSRWVRWEVQLNAQNRTIPIEVLINPGSFLVGAYPAALSWVGCAARFIATKIQRGKVLLECAILHAKRQVGSLISWLRDGKAMPDSVIVGKLIGREGRYPLRLSEYDFFDSYELPQDPWNMQNDGEGCLYA